MSDEDGKDTPAKVEKKRERTSKPFAVLALSDDNQCEMSPLAAKSTAEAIKEVSEQAYTDGMYQLIQLCGKPMEKKTVQVKSVTMGAASQGL